ncbi:23S rRNA (uracil(1939)-C(5))-methyltransferase RlmD [Bacterioplanes sanyensis]|uniref:hypothetical protein n=1 Tax=Bacterioplanes sanyensis TaxID=1249553 RepID=UPI001676CF12|nr:hypothetical protein [Bacterioplanes sanyensis]GGY45134.1 23S rRNA (uracil(1939)-C(5))-methyltransferase RlmD [Bacterioplanes sanyensis]
MVRQSSPRLLTLQVDNLTSEGLGVARRGRDVYFVPGALPGEEVEVSLAERRHKVQYTHLKRILKPSPERVEPSCPHYQRCGGCHLQHLSYSAQVQAKQARVAREFQRAGVSVTEWAPPLTAEPWHYRRKARLGVRYSQAKQQVYLGFREAGSSHLTDIDQCAVLIEHPLLHWQRWRQFLRDWPRRAELTQIEVLQTDQALVLTLRLLKRLDETSQQSLQAFVDQVFVEQPETTLPVQLWVKYHKDEPSQPLRSDYAPLHYPVDGAPLAVHPDDFIQVNGAINALMVQQAMAWLQPQRGELIADFFAGHGNFTMALARREAQVLALEGQVTMVTRLQQQAQQQGLEIQASCVDLSQAGGLVGLPDLSAVLLDPPRAGAEAVVEHLLDEAVNRILYVACDAATLTRDLRRLTQGGYRVVKAGIMDMFPQTHHVETMVLLTRVGK